LREEETDGGRLRVRRFSPTAAVELMTRGAADARRGEDAGAGLLLRRRRRRRPGILEGNDRRFFGLLAFLACGVLLHSGPSRKSQTKNINNFPPAFATLLQLQI
jgi:hypothetical protein